MKIICIGSLALDVAEKYIIMYYVIIIIIIKIYYSNILKNYFGLKNNVVIVND